MKNTSTADVQKFRYDSALAKYVVDIDTDILANEIVVELSKDGQTVELSCSPNDIDDLKSGFFYIIDKESPILSNISDEIEPKEMCDVMNELLDSSTSFKETANMHSSALCKDGKIIYLGEDISRFCSICKAIGRCVNMNDIPSKYYLCTTGRINSNVANKIVDSGIKRIVSKSAVTDRAIGILKENSIDIFGFANCRGINMY